MQPSKGEQVIRFKKTNKNYKEINNLFLNKYGKIMGSDTASGKWGDFRRRHPNLKKSIITWIKTQLLFYANE